MEMEKINLLPKVPRPIMATGVTGCGGAVAFGTDQARFAVSQSPVSMKAEGCAKLLIWKEE